MEAISHKNKKIVEYAKLKQKKFRDKLGLFLVEGEHLVEEAKKVTDIVALFSVVNHEEATLVTEQAMKKLTSLTTTPGLIAVCKKMVPTISGPRVLALDNVQDPGNVGTLIRSAKAFNWDAVIVKGVDIYNEKVIRATQGAIFHINVINTKDITKYFKGYQIVGAVLDHEAATINEADNDHEQKIMLVLGNEGKGISSQVMSKLDAKYYIPIDFESLNVASAGVIMLRHFKI